MGHASLMVFTAIVTEYLLSSKLVLLLGRILSLHRSSQIQAEEISQANFFGCANELHLGFDNKREFCGPVL